jgi:hypothetical protein
VESAASGGKAPAKQEKTGVYKHLLTGVSFMLPMVVAGGLMIACRSCSASPRSRKKAPWRRR